jgi:hypothetical protein
MDQLVAQGKFNWSLHLCTKNLPRKNDNAEATIEEETSRAPKGKKSFFSELIVYVFCFISIVTFVLFNHLILTNFSIFLFNFFSCF